MAVSGVASCAHAAAPGLVEQEASPATDPSKLEDKSRPAHEVYRNIKLFTRDAVSAEFFDELMQKISRDLGVPCAHCHDEAALHRDDLGPRKSLARETIPVMWRMVADINSEYFEGQGAPVRCWTCHQGLPAPARMPPPSPKSEGGRFPTAVGANLQVFEGFTPAQLKLEMKSIAGALGLECFDCHVEGDWGSDEKPRKRVAREMLIMTKAIDEKHFEPGRGPTCWTCHRGSVEVRHSPE